MCELLCYQYFEWVYHTTNYNHKILSSESFARWLVSLVLVLELALVLELELELALVLALDIEHYRITASVNHLTCPLPPHQSVI